jgi:hypothetical protein
MRLAKKVDGVEIKEKCIGKIANFGVNCIDINMFVDTEDKGRVIVEGTIDMLQGGRGGLYGVGTDIECVGIYIGEATGEIMVLGKHGKMPMFVAEEIKIKGM